MSAFDPFSKTLGSVIDERLSSPLISSFLIAWSVWNYKVFFILFADMPLKDRFKWLHDERFSGMDFLANGIGLPLIFTLVYIYWLPVPARLVYEAWRENQQKTDRIRNLYDDQKPIDHNEAREYRRQFRDFEEQIDALRTVNRTQREDLLRRDATVDDLQKRLDAALSMLDQSNAEQQRLRGIAAQLEARRERADRVAKWLDSLLHAIEAEGSTVDHLKELQRYVYRHLKQGIGDGDQLTAVHTAITQYETVLREAARITREDAFEKLGLPNIGRTELQGSNPPNADDPNDEQINNFPPGFQQSVHTVMRPSSPDGEPTIGNRILPG